MNFRTEYIAERKSAYATANQLIAQGLDKSKVMQIKMDSLYETKIELVKKHKIERFCNDCSWGGKASELEISATELHLCPECYSRSLTHINYTKIRNS